MAGRGVCRSWTPARGGGGGGGDIRDSKPGELSLGVLLLKLSHSRSEAGIIGKVWSGGHQLYGFVC